MTGILHGDINLLTDRLVVCICRDMLGCSGHTTPGAHLRLIKTLDDTQPHAGPRNWNLS